MLEQPFKQITESFYNFIPETVIIVTILVCILLDLILRKKSPIVASAGIAGLMVSGYFAIMQMGLKYSLFYNMTVIDPFAVFFKILFVVSTIFAIIFTVSSKEIQESTHHNEHVYIMLIMALGAYLMASSINMLMMYLSLETVSLSSYILSGYSKRVKRSSEASMKYIIYGAASSGIMIYGMSLLYGFTGTMNIIEMSNILAVSGVAGSPVLIISLVMVLAGLGYKISSVPFHFWTPDVYEGAPIPITAFLAVTSSAAGFALIYRFFLQSFLTAGQFLPDGKFPSIMGIQWNELIIVLSIASMVVGNFAAVWQQSIKRMLAYSSIAQGGYILLGLTVVNRQGVTAMIVYLIAYMFMNLGAFYALILASNKMNSDELIDMKGFGYRAPFVGFAMGVFMFALSGIPSTAGFIGKFYLFSALIESKMMWLALIGVLNSVVSLFFYIKVLKYMFLMKTNEENPQKLSFSPGSYIILILLILPTIILGLYFQPLIKIAEVSASFFGIN